MSFHPGHLKFSKDKNLMPRSHAPGEIRLDRVGNWLILYLLFVWLFLSLIFGQVRIGNIVIDSQTEPFFFRFILGWIILAMFMIVAYLKRGKTV